ncbi:hypothetical protein EKPJFOCH_0260 [Methylobacterium thuringiense]|uniref:Uncharacterized protein n=1 Tax=Methylobacterium thuringiense TaxID=1003091 RepID=A0ABQ4TGT3_9HYPH|nr:hypothetical protein EKPJFOCH_0260 [Methylobacterium thuringiense]
MGVSCAQAVFRSYCSVMRRTARRVLTSSFHADFPPDFSITGRVCACRPIVFSRGSVRVHWRLQGDAETEQRRRSSTSRHRRRGVATWETAQIESRQARGDLAAESAGQTPAECDADRDDSRTSGRRSARTDLGSGLCRERCRADSCRCLDCRTGARPGDGDRCGGFRTSRRRSVGRSRRALQGLDAGDCRACRSRGVGALPFRRADNASASRLNAVAIPARPAVVRSLGDRGFGRCGWAAGARPHLAHGRLGSCRAGAGPPGSTYLAG